MMNLLIPPIFDDEDKTLVAHHLFIIIWTLMAVAWLALLIAVILPETVYRWLLVVGVIESAGLILLALNRYGHTRFVSNLLIVIIWAVATGMALTGGGTSSNAMTIYLIVVLIAGLVLSGKAGLITAALCSLTGLFLVYLEYSGALPINRVSHTPLTLWIASTIYIAIIISLQYLASRTIRNALKQLRRELKERQRADAALRESEEKYRNLVENVSDVIYEIDSQGVVIYISPVVRDVMGYEQADIVGKKFIEFVYEDDRSRLIERFFELSEGIEYPFEYRLIHKSGDIRWVRTKTTPIMEGGSFKGARGTLIDITGRKQTEKALQQSEERYRTLVENASDIVFRTDENGYFTFVNPAALRVSGYEEGEVIGKHYKMFIRNDMFKEAITSFANQLIKKIPNTYTEYPILTKEGHEVWLGQNTQLIMKEDRVTGFQAVARDITERKRMEKELSDSEEKYRLMLENIQDGYYEVDLLGNLTFNNPSLSSILGYSKEELIGMNNRQYMDEENAKKVFRAFNTVYKTEEPTSLFEWELIRRDRTKAFVGCSVSLIKAPSGVPIGFRGIVRDITYKKKAEEALQHSERRYRELSIIDDLTQLYNSRYFYHQLKGEIDRVTRYEEQPMTLLLLDLDNFKQFNDAYGHVEGDQVLSRLGQVVKRCLRQTDSAYRYGGEEFTILLPMTTSKDAAVTAERIRTEFKKETFSPAPGKDVHVTVSIGLGQYKQQEDMK
ncbi:MAG: PAS domain S-box protein, partial [Syntrophus sp. (in: bacteria)]